MFSWMFAGSQRRRLLAEAIPESWRQIVRRNVGIYALLPPPMQQRLLGASRVIAAERRWVGCQGLEVTEEMRATVSAQAAVLLLGVDGYYFDKLPSVLLYPGTFVRRRAAGHEIVDEEAGALGEAWQGGSIVLSWSSALQGGRNPRDGQNVVLHEFAHHLDSLDGEAGGHPPMPDREAARRWDDVVNVEYARLVRMLGEGERTLLDPYAAESKAEFFAVATEVFFEQPVQLAAQHPQLYEILRDFYRTDPQSWFEGSALSGRGTATPHGRAQRLHRQQGAAGQTHDKLPPLRRTNEYFTRAWDSQLDGRYEDADADFSEVIRRQPRDSEALALRAECRLMLGRNDEALADAERICQLEPESGESRRIRGMCRAATGDSQGAIQDLDLAIAQGAADGEAHFYRGMAHADRDHWREALADFSAAIAADRADAEAWLERSYCHEALGDESAALGDRQTALSIDPTLDREEVQGDADEPANS